MLKVFGAAAAALLVSAPALAQITVDGTRDVAYGNATSHVTYQEDAPTSNFFTPTQYSDASSYDIYLTTNANSIFGFIQSDRVTPVKGANLYFDLDPQNGNGSDLVFEISNRRVTAFGDPFPTYAENLAGLSYAFSADGTGIEFSLANSLFTGPIAGLIYEFGANQQFASIGSPVTLRMSQSFGYSVAGGATYGPNRLGTVTLGAAATGAVPEPATWGMLILGFGLAGLALRRRSAVRTTVRFA